MLDRQTALALSEYPGGSQLLAQIKPALLASRPDRYSHGVKSLGINGFCAEL